MLRANGIRLQPCPTRRVVEQQPAELPCGESQQRHTRQPQQQHGLPSGQYREMRPGPPPPRTRRVRQISVQPFVLLPAYCVGTNRCTPARLVVPGIRGKERAAFLRCLSFGIRGCATALAHIYVQVFPYICHRWRHIDAAPAYIRHICCAYICASGIATLLRTVNIKKGAPQRPFQRVKG